MRTPSVQIRAWREIADQFCDSLLLGNGASIAIDSRFSYKSLLENALIEGLLTERVEQIFEYLDTRDFELVLRMVWHAHKINQALNLGESETEVVYREIRSALVKAVRKVHPEHEQVSEHLHAIFNFMKTFKKVLSLNYDLVVYWGMLKGNEELRCQWFKDCFLKESDQSESFAPFRHDWSWLSLPYGPAKGATLIFYPHGNLVLSTALSGRDIKEFRGNETETLLEKVLEGWEKGDRVPLFVSEGSSLQKRNAIRRSEYLNTVYDTVLSDLGSSLTVYGWSFGEQDDHILERISDKYNKTRVKRVAISVFTKDRPKEEIEEDCHKISQKIRRYIPPIDILFYDSKSPGCWIN